MDEHQELLVGEAAGVAAGFADTLSALRFPSHAGLQAALSQLLLPEQQDAVRGSGVAPLGGGADLRWAQAIPRHDRPAVVRRTRSNSRLHPAALRHQLPTTTWTRKMDASP